MKIVTHDSGFHTDDIFAVATLLLKYPDAEVVRSRDEGVIESADCVVDVGFIYNPEISRFDHHQPGGAGKRENGIEYASLGLVWKEFGTELAGGTREAELIDTILVQPIDAHDNGIAIAEYLFDGVREFTVGDFLESYLTRDDRTPEQIYAVFMKLVSIAQDLIKREIVQSKDSIKGEDIIIDLYEGSKDKHLIELPGEELPWRRVLSRYPEPLFILYKGKDNKWRIKGVPDTSKSYGSIRLPLPEVWSGLSGEDLRKVTGVEDAIFAHRSRFMAAAESREGAIRLAEIALNA